MFVCVCVLPGPIIFIPVRLFINGMFWSPQCTVTCGVGVMKRPVLCIKRLGKLMAIVDDENCLTDDKPDHTQPCQRAPCQPQWYTTDWTEVLLYYFNRIILLYYNNDDN